MKSAQSKANLIRAVLFAAVIAAVPVGIIFSKKQSISYDENRALAVFPKLCAKSYLSGQFMSGFSDYLSDHFIFREQIVSAKNKIETAVGKNEINGVLNLNGRLFEVFRAPDSAPDSKNAAAVNKFAGSQKNKGKTVFCLAPTAQELYKNELPFYANASDEKSYIEKAYSQVENAVCAPVSDAILNSPNDYLYYRTDHHWTSNGAFEAYRALGKQLGFTPLQREEFSVVSKNDDFLGTLYSKVLDRSLKPDRILNYSLKENEPKITIYDKNGGKINRSLYYEQRLTQKDKYSYFLGGNKDVVEAVNKTSGNGRSLLLIKDSYANSLVPFLSKHFSRITAVDLRYATPATLQKLGSASYSKTLILYNAQSFSEETTLTKLKFIG